MRKINLRGFLRRPETAAVLLCLAFGLGFLLGALSCCSHAGEAAVVVERGLADPAASVSEPVNINTADASELKALPGIGPALAERIVAYRNENGPFLHCYELTDVPGIGSGTYEALLGLITAEP